MTVTGSTFPSVDVAGIPVSATNLTRAADFIIDAAARARIGVPGMSVRLTNAYSIALAQRDEDYAGLLRGPGINFPDGRSVGWIVKSRVGMRRGTPAVQVRGPSLFAAVLQRSQGMPVRHFFLGTTDIKLQAMRDRISDQYPGVQIAGSYAPPMGPVTGAVVQRARKMIAESGANLVWVALGTPKQDFAATQVAGATGTPAVGVGAAFDFISGHLTEAPTWVTRVGFEWLHRFASEPRRLWRRYTYWNVVYVGAVARSVVRRHASGRREPSTVHPIRVVTSSPHQTPNSDED
jgi:N-acetylglucosaminyldiphosphoundecaprenol N-acetyl-beta-D-mannosaminyltransferase